MPISLTPIFYVFKKISKVHLNTLFALSIATYYVLTHTLPIVFRLPLPFSFFNSLNQIDTQNMGGEPQPPKGGPSGNHTFKTLHTESLQEQISPLEASINLMVKTGKSVSLLTNSTISPPNQVQKETIVKQKSDTDRSQQTAYFTHHTLEHSAYEPFLSQQMTAVKTNLSERQPVNELQVVEISQNPVVEPFLSQQITSVNTSLSERRPIDDLQIIEISQNPAIEISLSVENRQNESPQIESEEITLQPWNTYSVESYHPLLREWLMKLAPGGRTFSTDETLIRQALIKTLLSARFQRHVNLEWEEGDEEETQRLREEFCWAYMRNINWVATSNGRLFLNENEDLHQINELAYTNAYDFPLKRGIRVYRDEDFPSNRYH